jgi:dihydrofolate reductase
MAVSLIAALDENFAIGRHGKLPWHLPDDLRWFKQLTLGKYVLMGYNTALAIGRALPDRTNLVLSRRHEAPFPGQVTVRSIEEARARADGTGLMVIGGGQVYAETLHVAQRLYLTSTWSNTFAASNECVVSGSGTAPCDGGRAV